MELTTDFVVYIHGPPRRGPEIDACQKIIEEISGTIEKFYHGPFESPEALSQSLGRLLRLSSRPPPPTGPDVNIQRGILVLTELSDLMLQVIRPRRDLTAVHPQLASLLWIIFVDEDQPFFERSARELGVLDGGLHDAPLWSFAPRAETALQYLVLTANTDPTTARRRARKLVPSGFAKATSQGFRPPTLEEIEEAQRLYGDKQKP